jgi:hypothetical protein
MSTVTVTLELEAAEAAALKRFAEKANRDHALSVLYAHVARPIREDQASAMLTAFAELERALADVAVFPWIETGDVE